jgi:hypothetical protein
LFPAKYCLQHSTVSNSLLFPAKNSPAYYCIQLIIVSAKYCLQHITVSNSLLFPAKYCLHTCFWYIYCCSTFPCHNAVVISYCAWYSPFFLIFHVILKQLF